VPLYLADTSIWSWANSGRRPDIAGNLADRLVRDEVATCVPVMLEALHRARDGREYDELLTSLFGPVPCLPLADAVARRALDVQGELASTTDGNHLRPAVDYLIAAIAEQASDDVVLWFLDKDLRVICEHTQQPFQAEA
jgi:predicted nucleic acid-binding protein